MRDRICDYARPSPRGTLEPFALGIDRALRTRLRGRRRSAANCAQTRNQDLLDLSLDLRLIDLGMKRRTKSFT